MISKHPCICMDVIILKGSFSPRSNLPDKIPEAIICCTLVCSVPWVVLSRKKFSTGIAMGNSQYLIKIRQEILGYKLTKLALPKFARY